MFTLRRPPESRYINILSWIGEVRRRRAHRTLEALEARPLPWGGKLLLSVATSCCPEDARELWFLLNHFSVVGTLECMADLRPAQ